MKKKKQNRFRPPQEMNDDRIARLIEDLGIENTVYVAPTVSGELAGAHFELITERMYLAFTTAKDSAEVPEKLFTWTCQLVSEALQLTALMFRQGKRVTQSEDYLATFRKQHDNSTKADLAKRCEELRHDMKVLVLQFTGKHYTNKSRLSALYGIWVTLFQILDLETLIIERHYGVESSAVHV
jgi:hypothetical protein